MPLDDSMYDAIQDWRRHPEASPQELRPDWPPERQQDLERRIAILRRGDSDHVVEKSAPELPFPVPDRVGRYQMVELLGEGGFGQVWKAVDPESGRLFAVKVPSLAPEKRDRALRMLRDESRWLVMLREVDGILPFQDRVLDDRCGFALVMEYMPGGSLAAVLKSKGKLPAEEAARLMIRIARTVAAANERDFIHQDLKPANILIDERGQPWVADFGLAVFEPVRRHRGGTQSGGTRLYRAPEQLRGETDYRSDIWSLGVILWEMLTGSVPFRDETEVMDKPLPAHLLRKMPPELARIVRTCLQKDPDQRFLHANEIAQALQTFVLPPGVRSTPAPVGHASVAITESKCHVYESLHHRHETIVGRKWAIDRVRRLVGDRARSGGLIVIVGQPGKGKSALMAHLARDTFMACEPPAIEYAYHSAHGVTSPDDFVRTLYGRLLQVYQVADTSESATSHSPEGMLIKLNDFVCEEAPKRVSPANPQLVMVDAIDEARESHTGRMAWQMIPETLPPGVVFIVSSRPSAAEPLLRRPDAVKLDLDDPDDRVFHDQDTRAYIDRQFRTRRLTPPQADEIVRASKGNFLVLKHLCVELHLAADEARVADLLQRLLGSENALLTVYEDFWERLAFGVREDDPDLYQSMCDVAGVLATASARMSAEMVCSILGGMKSGTWAFVRRRLGEYIESWVPDDQATPYYRTYHATFAEFIRTKMLAEGDRKRLHGLLAEFCLRAPENDYAKEYALRFAPWHLQHAERWDELHGLLTDLRFLEAKTQAGFVFDLARDFDNAVLRLPGREPERRLLRLLGEALRRDIHFIHRHANDYPQGLFQCLWNTCWWYDCEEAASRYVEPDQGWSPENAPWMQPADQKLCRLLERWRDQKMLTAPGLVWLRTHGPPPVRLGTAQEAVLRGHDDEVNSVMFSPDGLRIASGSMDGTIRVWDATSGAQLASLCDHEDGVNSVTYSADGRRIASGSTDGTVRVWDAESGAQLAILCEHEGGVNSVTYSPDGRRIAGGFADGRIRVWDTDTGAEVMVWRAARDGVNSVVYSPDGRWIAAGSDDGTIRVWNSQSGAKQTALRMRHSDDAVTSVAYSVDGRRIASGYRDQGFLLWDAEAGTDFRNLCQDPSSDGASVTYSADGRRIASASRDGTISVYDAETCAELAVYFGHEGPVHSVAYSPDGRRIASGSSDRTIRVWNTDKCDHFTALRRVDWKTRSAAYSPDGRHLAIVRDYDAAFHSRDAEPASPIPSFSDWTELVARLATVEVPAVYVCDTESGTKVAVMNGQSVTCVVYSPDGRRMAGGSDRVHEWDAESGAWLRAMRGHKGSIKGLAYSPDGRRIAVAYEDGTLQEWNAESGTELGALDGAGGGVSYSPDGRRIVSACETGTVRVWDPERGELLAVFPGHKDRVDSVTYSSDGRRIVSESFDGTIRMWDAQTGECLQIIEGSGDVKAIAAGASEFPLRGIARIHETVIERAEDGKPIAWFPVSLTHVVTHPSGRTWAGVVGGHLFIIRIEGNAESATREHVKTP